MAAVPVLHSASEYFMSHEKPANLKSTSEFFMSHLDHSLTDSFTDADSFRNKTRDWLCTESLLYSRHKTVCGNRLREGLLI